jgi:Xaa-Pro aminopeptidase
MSSFSTARPTSLPVVRDEEYEERRKRFFAALPPGSLAIFVTNQEQMRNGSDNTFAHRPSSDVLYLSGFSEPNCVLVFDKTADQPKFTMFVEPFDLQTEIWHGKRLGEHGAKLRCGADQAYQVKSIRSKLTKLAAKASRIYYKSGLNKTIDAQVQAAIEASGHSGRIKDSDAILGELRLIKTASECDIMKRSANVGSLAHEAAMMHCQLGLTEYDLKGIIEFVFASHKCEPSYGTIVATGANGLCLHYPAGFTPLGSKDLVLIDAGSEMLGYASDISRTFPVSGKFSPEQKEIYELVLATQKAAIDAVKPGTNWDALENVAHGILLAGLQKLGFPMSTAAHGSEEAKSAHPNLLLLEDVMPHGLGHWLGLDVHDVGNYLTRPPRGTGNKSRKHVARPLEEGMVITIEPGLYLRYDQRIPKKYQGIAVRIEDDILVTDDGSLTLTDAVKEVDEIEALMSWGRKLRQQGFDPLLFVESLKQRF